MMFLKRAVVISAFLFVSCPPVASQVVINEFSYDDWRTDQPDIEEFVELYNGGAEAVGLDGWAVTTGGAAGLGLRYELPAGATIEAKGFYVVGSSQVPAVDHAVGDTDLFGNGADYILLLTPAAAVADSVAYEMNKGTAGFPAEALDEGGVWGNHVLVPTTHLSWQRWFDGWDTEENGADFGNLPWTPGASNNRQGPAVFSRDFEEFEPETELDEFPGSFVRARVVDPLVVSASNPNPIAESPDGGNVLVVWDPAGGGNFAVLETEPAADLTFEAWVYLDATLRPVGESETWSIGLCGTSGPFYNIPILFDQNGNTGVTWTYQVTETGATLFLVDEGVGGPAGERPRLAEILIAAGSNDGWQRLRLQVEGDAVTGHFGGTYGSLDDGVVVEDALRVGMLGSFYMGYRESVGNLAAARPLTLDALVVGPPATGAEEFKRGDANADGDLNIADAISVLGYLFGGGADPSCADTADANDDGAVNIADAITILGFLFGGDGPLPDPAATCGVDPSGDDLPCERYDPCRRR